MRKKHFHTRRGGREGFLLAASLGAGGVGRGEANERESSALLSALRSPG